MIQYSELVKNPVTQVTIQPDGVIVCYEVMGREFAKKLTLTEQGIEEEKYHVVQMPKQR